MERAHHSPVSTGRVRITSDAHGSVTSVIDALPQEMPAVRKRDVELAWHAAHRAARLGEWGVVRGFRFQRADSTAAPYDLLLAEANAACWAAAVDAMVGLGNLYGLSLCLRLLALVDLLARARWADGLYRMHRGEAEMDARLLRLAAAARLTPQAGFDADGFRAILCPPTLAAPDTETTPPPPRLTGASA
jgi:hypothetical protein